MKTKMLTKARQLWNTGNPRLDRRNQRAWVQAIRRLGDKWLLAQHVPRKEGVIKNEPAFPITPGNYKNMDPPKDGITLRDYFAAKAMQGFVSRWHAYDAEFDAARAYAFADAMLKARKK